MLKFVNKCFKSRKTEARLTVAEIENNKAAIESSKLEVETNRNNVNYILMELDSIKESIKPAPTPSSHLGEHSIHPAATSSAENNTQYRDALSSQHVYNGERTDARPKVQSQYVPL